MTYYCQPFEKDTKSAFYTGKIQVTLTTVLMNFRDITLPAIHISAFLPMQALPLHSTTSHAGYMNNTYLAPDEQTPY